jgi:FKBP-type peptidyl-prolyl cis-trans isomerase SlyD
MEEKNIYLSASYELYVTMDGKKEQVEKAPEDHPFQFITGLGFTLPAFENQLKALKEGEAFDFVIPVEEAYGERKQEYILDLPKNIFMIDGKFDAVNIQAGKMVPLMTNDGQRVQGTVIEVKEDVVVMDMNHPLAGKDLNFVGKLVATREASPEEMQEFLTAMSGNSGCSGCSSKDGDDCNCGDCGSNENGCGCS